MSDDYETLARQVAEQVMDDRNVENDKEREALIVHVIALGGIFQEVRAERLFQRERWAASERLPDGTGGAGRGTYETIARNACDRADREGRLTHAHVFEEETAEVLNATERPKLRKELVQVMAVCAKWIEDIDRRAVCHAIDDRLLRQMVRGDAENL